MRRVIDDWVRHFSDDGALVLLESQLKGHMSNRFTYLAARPVTTIKAKGREIEISKGDKLSRFKANPWEALKEFWKKQNDDLFGYLGYDLKNHTEQLTSSNEDKTGAPDLFFMVPSVLMKLDHINNKTEVIKGSMPEIKAGSFKHDDANIETIDSSITRENYISGVEQIKNDIYEGEYYELNFTHQLQAGFTGSAYRLYQKMCEAGPVPFGAYIQLDDLAVCCLSPERFLRKTGKKVTSQPIKGTIKRAESSAEDDVLKHKLKTSVKDRAENMMIVDLVRNDLSRVTQPGSVKVEHLYEIQSFATVHQMVSTVSAVAGNKEPIEIIKACFPMGSMTGAPKIKVMQAIEKLEDYKRGIYSGAIGYITADGNFDFNVVIRTAIVKGNNLFYSVGGAITADSNPSAEWEESWLKAEALKGII